MRGARLCKRVTWNPPWSFRNLAPLAHEMGHGYGLPHSDNSDGDDDTYDNPWDLMSDAWRNAVSDATHGLLPKQLNMAQRDRLGWVAQDSKRGLDPRVGDGFLLGEAARETFHQRIILSAIAGRSSK